MAMVSSHAEEIDKGPVARKRVADRFGRNVIMLGIGVPENERQLFHGHPHYDFISGVNVHRCRQSADAVQARDVIADVDDGRDK